MDLTVHLMQLETQDARFKVESDDHRSEGEFLDFENPFHRILPTRWQKGRGDVFEQSTHWFDSIRVDLPEYLASLQTEVFLDWLDQIEYMFEYKKVLNDEKVKVVIFKLTGRASAWWRQLKKIWEHKRQTKNSKLEEDESVEGAVFTLQLHAILIPVLTELVTRS